LFLVVLLAPLVCPAGAAAAKHPASRPSYISDVREFGATGDGKTVDTAAINAAIDSAASAGGGTVRFPAGVYLSVSIHLRSNITLDLGPGATILAAAQKDGVTYDPAEQNGADASQDFGHSHWHNSLIWGENLENVSIVGSGTIWGKDLVRGHRRPDDPADKAIALKLCRNVTVRDITIKHGGHFAILASGVDNITIDNVKIDTNRDGIDVDCCRAVRISNCSINAPADDGICLKSSYALGQLRATESVTISNCQLTGYDEGTFLDGTCKRDDERSKRMGPTSRIKLGTESNGAFRNITISNCVFDYTRGLALETVDGAVLEDVSISNITMRDTVDSPIFLRLGSRLRGPSAGGKAGALRRVSISHIICSNADPTYGCIITGIPGHPIEDVALNDIRIQYRGGGKGDPTTQPAESESVYPDPPMFGLIPSYGFFIRHVSGIEMENIAVSCLDPETRPPFSLSDVQDASFCRIRARRGADVPAFQVKDVKDFSAQQCEGIADIQRETVAKGEF
jgi:polygalacturonase